MDVMFVSPGVFKDGGGFIITSNGIKPIPPWDPGVLVQAKAINSLLRAAQHLGARRNGRVMELATAMAEEVVANGGDGNVVFFFDEDGGWCGTPWGRPPFPLPRPGGGGPQVRLG